MGAADKGLLGLSTDPFAIGILHSRTGTLSIGENALIDATLLAIDEINKIGGVLNRPIEAIVEDTQSDPNIFEQKVKNFVNRDITTLFGGWSSTARKLAIPILETYNALLFYPVQYEGLEYSPAVFYSGACPNQQIKPAVEWLFAQGKKRFFLLGMDYVFPRVCHTLLKAQIAREGGVVVGEALPALENQDFSSIIQQIQAMEPDAVFSTLNGDANLAFYDQYQSAGIDAANLPVMAISISEQELQMIGQAAVGHYATWNYFQSLPIAENTAFIQKFQQRYGNHRVTCDPVAAAYTQVYLWRQAVEAAGSLDCDRVREAMLSQGFEGPGGRVTVSANHHLNKPVYIGQIQADGQFLIVHDQFQIIPPEPWLGVEKGELSNAQVIVDLLAEVPRSIQYSCQLEKKTRDLTAANKQLHELNQRVELLRRNLSGQIRKSLDLETILNTAVKEICSLLSADICQFLWYQRQGDRLVQQTSYASYHHSQQPNPTIEDALLKAVQSIYHDWVESPGNEVKLKLFQAMDLHQQALSLTQDVLAEIEMGSTVIVPVYANCDRLGVLICLQQQPSAWTSMEMEMLEDVADQLAIAIDHANLYTAAQLAAQSAEQQAHKLENTLLTLRETQAQLIQVEKMSGLGRMVAGIAHEVNNPVTFIHNNLDHVAKYFEDLLMLADGYAESFPGKSITVQAIEEEIELDFLRADLPAVIQSMKEGTRRIRDIVLGLRNFSRLDETGLKPVNLNDGIESALLMLQHRLQGQFPITIRKQYGGFEPIVCHANQINQVLLSLLTNAIDALSLGKVDNPTIAIDTGVTAEFFTIEIWDNGTGITPEVQTKIFDPFFTTKPVGQGTGLGLATSYQIITQHNGQITVDSITGKGTKFLIKLPRHNQPDKI